MAKDKKTMVGRVDVAGIGAVLVTKVQSSTTGETYLTVSVQAEADFEVMATTGGTAELVVLKKS